MEISKSKQKLASIITENGGWISGNYAIQDKDDKCIWFMFKLVGRPRGRAYWPGAKSNGISCDKVLPNWHKTILSRDEYFHLYPAPDADGWIAFNGYNKPDFGDLVVEVMLRDGEISGDGPQEADYWDWSIDGSPGDIISYRPRKPEIAPTEPDLNPVSAPDAKPTIEQLAADYRAKLEIAQQAQEEADSHRCGAEAAIEKLVAAGTALGLVLSVEALGPELVITDWRDLREGDIIELTACIRYRKTECTMVYVPGVGLRAKSADDTENQWWNLGGRQESKWRFIRHP